MAGAECGTRVTRRAEDGSERPDARRPGGHRAPFAPGPHLAAAALLAVKAGLGLWAGYALLTASATHHRTFLGGRVSTRHSGLGTVLLVLAAVSVIVAVGLLLAQSWSRAAAFALEGVGAVLAASRLVSHPGSSFVSLALAAAIIGLLLTRRTSSRPSLS